MCIDFNTVKFGSLSMDFNIEFIKNALIQIGIITSEQTDEHSEANRHSHIITKLAENKQSRQ